jgi:hypothetical protein
MPSASVSQSRLLTAFCCQDSILQRHTTPVQTTGTTLVVPPRVVASKAAMQATAMTHFAPSHFQATTNCCVRDVQQACQPTRRLPRVLVEITLDDIDHFKHRKTQKRTTP